ncbi:RidA family protein [Jiangella alkaliphila]|uniref:Enamine deaminase RidA, house cleaning of reactive enamine intermediates, YjgF/YER057c/UK114 family n=1 Tax=Jiangella alkaliphila TaxID=419479 RepID=A0A1H2K186_9ACTN|nr:RidA family protein [Jiangella alkaliphila]SDU62168.1 Enamine deaminase RidA, house cleaning of reactive enamine intermediates, YjgF/YER057c/UK114 family [Jiangella alkaliphila]
MTIERLDPAALPAASGNYTHGTLITGARRTVYVSGQVPWADADGRVPPEFEEQCRLTWRHVLTVLAEAGMGAEHLAKVTTYLSDRRYREANSRIRQEVLGDHRPALTIIITDIYSEDWLLEIDAVAVG